MTTAVEVFEEALKRIRQRVQYTVISDPLKDANLIYAIVQGGDFWEEEDWNKESSQEFVNSLGLTYRDFLFRAEPETPETNTWMFSVVDQTYSEQRQAQVNEASVPKTVKVLGEEVGIGSKFKMKGSSWEGWTAEVLNFINEKKAYVVATRKGSKPVYQNINLSRVIEIIEVVK